MVVGSPPPTRGTLSESTCTAGGFGITPAYAGNTIRKRNKAVASKDHPRLRGEHKQLQNNVRKYRGSPPPTRGTLHLVKPRFYSTRITPAYAGNTSASCNFRDFDRDHPRLRGEHYSTYYLICDNGGSPPPTRGTLMIK